jgi:hypothetical protein
MTAAVAAASYPPQQQQQQQHTHHPTTSTTTRRHHNRSISNMELVITMRSMMRLKEDDNDDQEEEVATKQKSSRHYTIRRQRQPQHPRQRRQTVVASFPTAAAVFKKHQIEKIMTMLFQEIVSVEKDIFVDPVFCCYKNSNSLPQNSYRPKLHGTNPKHESIGPLYETMFLSGRFFLDPSATANSRRSSYGLLRPQYSHRTSSLVRSLRKEIHIRGV